MRYLLLTLWLFCQASWAAPRQLDDYRWENVGRIVAIGDLHGDYSSYIAALMAAGVVDAGGHWIAGDTHLVQTGDIPDRGPDTRRIIEHMGQLAREAARRGGRVHNLMGNHEAMNVYGDLRYVVEGEYAAYADKRSGARRNRYFAAVMAALQRSDPKARESLPTDYRQQWDRQHPLGWVEHRAAWDPRWNAQGAMYLWTLQTKVAVQLDDLVFLHGGISSAYCGNSLESLTTMARGKLRLDDPANLGILEDERGPLWYRGLAGVAPAAPVEAVDAILQRHGARHIVIGHTPTSGIIWPRLDGRIVMIDTGLSAAHGSHVGWLEATREGGLVAGYRGGRVPLPKDDAARADYLDKVIALDPGNEALIKRRDALRTGNGDPVEAEVGATPAPAPAPTVTCDISR